MLVLQRRFRERIIIRTPEGREIVVAVLRLDGESVRVGIVADRDVTIYRDEIQQQIDAGVVRPRDFR